MGETPVSVRAGPLCAQRCLFAGRQVTTPSCYFDRFYYRRAPVLRRKRPVLTQRFTSKDLSQEAGQMKLWVINPS